MYEAYYKGEVYVRIASNVSECDNHIYKKSCLLTFKSKSVWFFGESKNRKKPQRVKTL